MKKVMFLVVGMLFAASVNAATIEIINDGDLNNGGTGDGVSGAVIKEIAPNNGPLAVIDFEVTELDVEIANDVVNTGGSWSIVSWVFTPGAITGDVFDNSLGTYVDVAGLLSYSFSMYMADGATYYMDFDGTALIGSTISMSVQALPEVPVPAALFLFAPALLGFFGLRRKAAVAA